MGDHVRPELFKEIYELLPHRPPMLFINELISLGPEHAETKVLINNQAAFFEPDKGVPAWIGLEYMGQTAALIAGYQLKMGLVEPHLGFLLGTRSFKTNCSYFADDQTLEVSCQEKAVMGESLATFACTIANDENKDLLASAVLSVFRKPESKS